METTKYNVWVKKEGKWVKHTEAVTGYIGEQIARSFKTCGEDVRIIPCGLTPIDLH